jgi:hypothetical protein
LAYDLVKDGVVQLWSARSLADNAIRCGPLSVNQTQEAIEAIADQVARPARSSKPKYLYEFAGMDQQSPW